MQLAASTRQATLVAVSTLGHALGQSHPQPIIAVLPALVAAAQDKHRSVRSSALAAAAACLSALGSQALPLLPKMVPAVIAAAQAAVDGLATSSPDCSEVTFPPAADMLQQFWTSRMCLGIPWGRRVDMRCLGVSVFLVPAFTSVYSLHLVPKDLRGRPLCLVFAL